MACADGLTPIHLGLERIQAVCEALGRPQDRLPPIIHIAGTNGKGSTAAFLTAIFQRAGYRVHRYTSPHLVRRNERILLAGEEISDAMLEACLSKVSAADVPSLTPFETETAAAFLAMAECAADIAIIEVGLGGRLDATNILHPCLTVLTPVAIDHAEFLGETLPAIAAEKAGIIKPGVPCVVGKQAPEAWHTIATVAQAQGAPMHRNLAPLDMHVAPSLAGAHQYDNARTAAQAARQLRAQFPLLTDEVIEAGIRTATWPARLQQLGERLWLDGGHNPQGGEVLAAFLENTPKVHLICGMMRDKDTRGYLAPLVSVAGRLTAVTVPDEPRSRSAEATAAIARLLGIEATVARGVEDALRTSDREETTVICGSLYLAGYILRCLKNADVNC